jgi:hypothetical protein
MAVDVTSTGNSYSSIRRFVETPCFAMIDLTLAAKSPMNAGDSQRRVELQPSSVGETG